MMKSKERMLVALGRGKPDRLPVTIHQWQGYHLRKFMGGVDQLTAFRQVGLDASFLADNTRREASPNWLYRNEFAGKQGDEQLMRHWIATPRGELTWLSGSNDYTTYNIEHIIKTERDAEIFLDYLPPRRLDKVKLAADYDRVGDDGIVRGFVDYFAQPGTWQEFCEMVGTERAIYWAMDDPVFVHSFLDRMTRRKLEYIERELPGAKYDLIEHGGGAASSTVISPSMFDEFCVPYDKRIIDALHQVGLPVVYHTCGGMMAILDRIPSTGCDASETLSPPGVGGDIQPAYRSRVKDVLGSKVALIGGVDQGSILTDGTPAQVAAEVRACFAAYGRDGGYICSASDHFFHTPVANLRAMAEAGHACRYD
jgi:hypothetical protein